MTLQAYNPDSLSDPARLTLREAFERHLLPDILACDARGTLQAYRGAINHWERHLGAIPVSALSNALMAQFRDQLLARGLAPATVNKIWRHCRSILRRIGPRHDRNPFGLSLIPEVPAMRAPRPRPLALPRDVSNSDIDLLFRACRVATWPYGDSTLDPLVWRTMLVLSHNYGPRTWDTWQMRWRSVDPHLLYLRAQKTGKLAGLPYNSTTAGFLNALKRLRYILAGSMLLRHPVQDCPVFCGSLRRAPFYQQWAAINHAACQAGLSRPVEFRQLRESCRTKYDAFGPQIGMWILGHAPKGVSDTYYLNPSRAVRDAVEAFPQPTSFTQWLKDHASES